MARQKFEKSFNTFVKGLMTEASEINFPENYSLYEKNFELRRDGGRDRRKGMDLLYPLGVTLTSLPYPQFTGDSTESRIEFLESSLTAFVKRAGYPADVVRANLSFPLARIRTAIEEYTLKDAATPEVSFPQATLRAPLVEIETSDATEASIEFPEATLRHALIKIDYTPDATEATIEFPEATLYEPN